MFLAAWYVAGNVVASMYGSSKKRKKKSAGSKEEVKLIVEGFLDTHKNFISDVEKKYIPKDKREVFEEKKNAFLTAAQKYMKKGEEMIQDIKENEAVKSSTKKAGKTMTALSEKGRVAVAKTAQKMKKTDENEF